MAKGKQKPINKKSTNEPTAYIFGNKWLLSAINELNTRANICKCVLRTVVTVSLKYFKVWLSIFEWEWRPLVMETMRAKLMCGRVKNASIF